MTSERHDYRFGRDKRITRKQEIERAFAGRCTAGDERLVVYAVPNDLAQPRMGVTIGRKHGGAVRRNRIRRLLREAFRLEQHNLPGGFDLLLVPRAGAEAELEAYRQSLVRLAGQAVRRWQARSRHTAGEGPGAQRSPEGG